MSVTFFRELTRSAETLIITHKPTLRHNPENYHRHLHRHENHKSEIFCQDEPFDWAIKLSAADTDVHY
jgi:hypothetical protein